jgi:hypothetical protein
MSTLKELSTIVETQGAAIAAVHEDLVSLSVDLHDLEEIHDKAMLRIEARIAKVENALNESINILSAAITTLQDSQAEAMAKAEAFVKAAMVEAQHLVPKTASMTPAFVPNKARARVIAMQLRTHAGYGSAFVNHTPQGYVLTLNASDAEALNKPNLHTQGALLRPEKVEAILAAAAEAAA